MEFSLGLGYLPVVWTLLTLSAVVVSYAVSISNGHVYPFLPAISDTGSRSPEANIFSMLMNMSIFASLFNFYTRFYQCQLQAKYCRDNRETILRLNRISAFFSGCSIFGAVIVANVQSRKASIRAPLPHRRLPHRLLPRRRLPRHRLLLSRVFLIPCRYQTFF